VNFAAITRRIRRCESEVPAQLVLEYAIAEAVAAEREACAKVCEDRPLGTTFSSAEACAAAIRARSNAELKGAAQQRPL
jgi:hypothetical protein